MNIKGLNFVKTCDCSPEQYDVFDNNNNIVGYIRLRWGSVSCRYPDVSGRYIYSAGIRDGWAGCFKNESQRKFHLDKIADVILRVLENPEELDWINI